MVRPDLTVVPAESGRVLDGGFQTPHQEQFEAGPAYASLYPDATNYPDIGYEVAERKLVLGRLSLCCRLWVDCTGGDIGPQLTTPTGAFGPVGGRMQ